MIRDSRLSGARPAQGSRILAVSPVPPWPPNGGTHHRVASQLRALSTLTGMPVDLVILRAPAAGPSAWFDAVNVVADVPLGPDNRVPGERMLRAVVFQKPIGIHRRLASAARHAQEMLGDQRYALHWIFKAEIADNWEPRGVPMIVDLDDIESRKTLAGMAAVAEQYPKSVRPLVAYRDRMSARGWGRLQASAVGRSSGYLVCAQEDADAIPGAPCFVVPNAVVGLPDDAADHPRPDAVTRILLHGTLTYAPNADAVQWLLSEIAPQVWSQEPEIVFQLAGRVSPELVERFKDDRIEFSGFVPDMLQLVQTAGVVVAPLRYGGGTRVKLIEAAATAAPIVATSIGAEGLPFTPGTDIVIADDAAAFARAIVSLARDPAARRSLGSAARATYVSQMSQDTVTRAVAEVLDAVL